MWSEVMCGQVWLLVVNQYIAKADISADIWHFSNIGIGRYVFLFGWCVRGGTFILTALRTAPEHTALTFSLLFAVIIQSNSDISLSNNQIEMLNNGIKMYAKKVL